MIEIQCFSNCKSINKIVLSDDVVEIKNGAFNECSNLEEITIPKNVTIIEKKAFQNCRNLSKVIFEGNAPSSFGTNVFYNCSSDFTIYINKDAQGFTTPTWNGYPVVVIDDSEDTTESTSETSSEKLTETTTETTPEELFVIDEEGFIVDYVGDIKDVVIPALINGVAVKGIGRRAFLNKTTLKNVTLPESIESIEGLAFYRCINLEKVIFKGNAPTEIGYKVFDYTDEDFTIYYYEGAIGFDKEALAEYNKIMLNKDGEEFKLSLGDANGDGTLTQEDVMLIIQKALDYDFITEAEKKLTNGFEILDVDEDNVITATDATILQNQID